MMATVCLWCHSADPVRACTKEEEEDTHLGNMPVPEMNLEIIKQASVIAC